MVLSAKTGLVLINYVDSSLWLMPDGLGPSTSLADKLMKKPKVSFDFDHTLSHPHVQEYAQQLIDQGVDVWVITTRYDENHLHKYAMDYPPTLDDLWEVVMRLGIPKHKVRFTCMEWKYTYLTGTEFLWHLDDNEHEIRRSQYNKCNVPMIQVHGGGWQKKCDRLLSKYKAKQLEKLHV